MENTQVYKSSEMLDILFENRNKEYGAYVLRKDYSKMLMKAFVIALVIVGVSLAWPIISSMIKPESALVPDKKIKITKITELAEPPPLNENTPPPPKMEVPPLKETIKFTPPQITKEEIIEETMPDQEELKVTTVATTSQEGEIDYSGLETGTQAEIEEGTGEEEEVLEWVEQNPEFPGGEEAMLKWVSSNISYPKAAIDNNISGRVIVQFVVDKEGNISNIKVIRSLPFCDEEAIRVIKKMPKWKPGKNNGKAVSVFFQMPIDFQYE